jgi:hypothetical protein
MCSARVAVADVGGEFDETQPGTLILGGYVGRQSLDTDAQKAPAARQSCRSAVWALLNLA